MQHSQWQTVASGIHCPRIVRVTLVTIIIIIISERQCDALVEEQLQGLLQEHTICAAVTG